MIWRTTENVWTTKRPASAARPRSHQYSTHGGRGREQAGCSVAAVEGVHDVKMRITPPANMGIRMKSPSSNPVRAAGRARTGR